LPSQVISEFAINNSTIEVKNDKTKIINVYNLSDGELLSSEKFSAKGGPASGWKTSTSSEGIISPDKNKKLYILNNQLWIDYLNDTKKEPIKNAGEKELIVAYELSINFFDWFNDSERLIWFTNGELTVAELDNRGGKRNSVKFYLNIDSPVFWDRNNSDFYFFENTAGKNILYKISFKA